MNTKKNLSFITDLRGRFTNTSGLFPLTLPLSLGEREPPPAPGLESEAYSGGSDFGPLAEQDGGPSGDVRAPHQQQRILPLPKGEGWGEGEQDGRLSRRFPEFREVPNLSGASRSARASMTGSLEGASECVTQHRDNQQTAVGVGRCIVV